MPIRIPELPAAITSGNADLLPISQFNGAKRATYKITLSQLKEFVNLDLKSSITNLTTNVSNYLPLAGGTLTNYLFLHADPSQPKHAATKGYTDTLVRTASTTLDTSIGTKYLPLVGGSLINYLTLHAVPTNTFHAATKGYTDTLVRTASTTLGASVATIGSYLPLAGGTLTGPLTLNADPTTNLHSATKGYTDTKIRSLSNTVATDYLHVSGGTLTNFLTLNADPTNNLHAVPKQYVLSKAGGTMTGPIDLNGNKLQKFNVEVIPKSAAFNLDMSYNGAIIPMTVSGETKVTIAPNVLTVGFSTVIIQMGDGGIRLATSGTPGVVQILNVNNSLLTRKKYAQMNICVVEANKIWISGDLA